MTVVKPGHVRLSHGDCVLNATSALLLCGGARPTATVAAQAALAEAWLRLAAELKPGGWVDIPENWVK